METDSALEPSWVIDRRLLEKAAEGFGQVTPEELSEAVQGHYNPAEAQLRVKEILSTWDAYTVIEEHKLLLFKAVKFLNSMERDVHFGDPQARNTYLQGLRYVGEIFEKTSQHLADKESSLSQRNAEIMVEAIELALHRALESLRRTYPELSELEIRDALQGALPSALAEVSKYAKDE